jgi:hypothetical protein
VRDSSDGEFHTIQLIINREGEHHANQDA